MALSTEFCRLEAKKTRTNDQILVTLSTTPISDLEATDKSYFYKTDKNNYVPTRKPKALSVSVSVKLFCSQIKFETLSTFK